MTGKLVGSVLGMVSCVALATIAAGVRIDDPCGDMRYYGQSNGVAGSCETWAVRACWREGHSGEGILAGEPVRSTGPLNLDLWEGVAMPDYPPLSSDPIAGTLPLLSSSVAQYSARGAAQSRATLNGTVDLITGAPLLKEVDFTLPFGTAVYRHVRSFGEYYELGMWEAGVSQGAAGGFWDWCGQGWMMGVAPILLVDSGYFGWSSEPGTQRCYAILDSHHAIPFNRIPATQGGDDRYVAPGARAARLIPHSFDNDGTAESFTLYLDDAGLRYDFDVVKGDVYPGLHAPAETSSVEMTGVPYYALCKTIADQNGNRIFIEYAPPAATDRGQAAEGGCWRCCENCRDRGRVERVLLQSKQDEVWRTHWTLLFAYRDFHVVIDSGGSSDNDCSRQEIGETVSSISRQRALHSVFVYKHDDGTEGQPIEYNVPENFGVIPFRAYWRAGCMSTGQDRCGGVNAARCEEQHAGNVEPHAALGRLSEVDVLNDESGVLAECGATPWDPAGTGPLQHWYYEVKYLYDDDSDVFLHSERAAAVFDAESGTIGMEQYYSPRLRAVTVRQRDPEALGMGVQRTCSLYRYRAHSLEQLANDPIKLTGTIDNAAIGRLKEAVEAGNGLSPNEPEALAQAWPYGLLYVPIDMQLTDETGQSQKFSHWLTQRFCYWDSPDEPGFGLFDEFCRTGTTPVRPAYRDEMEGDYVAQGDLAAHGYGVHVFVDRSGGQERYFKMYKFMKPPGARVIELGVPHELPALPLRAISHEPFAYVVGEETMPVGTGSADHYQPLKDPMWITVIDEYPSLAACRVIYASRDSVNSAAEGMKPLSRRAVQMNRAGYVLSDRTWNLTDGQITAASGFTEEFEYDDSRRLTQHRTVGWGSAGNSEPEDLGLIELFEYEADDPDDQTPPNMTPLLVKIKRGIEGSEILLKQNAFEDPDRPDLLTHEIVFTSPTTNIVNVSELPGTALEGIEWTLRQYEIDQTVNTECPDQLKPILSVRTIRPKTRREPGAADGYYAFEFQSYDHGRAEWRAYGSVQNLAAPGNATTGDLLAFDYNLYDAQGRLAAKILDVSTDFTLAAECDFTPLTALNEYPNQWERVQSGGTALNYATRFQNDAYGVKLTRFANGRYELRKLSFDTSTEGDVVETVTYRDLWPYTMGGPGGTSTFDVLGQVEYSRVVDGSPKQSQLGTRAPSNRVDTNYNFDDPGSSGQSGEIDALSTSVAFETDAGGNPRKIEARSGTLTGNADLAVEMSIGRIGELQYQKDPAGNITHTLHTPRGQVERVFKGTDDTHEFWGDEEAGENENMYLAEGRIYGTGVNDALQLTEVRRYRQRYTDQYTDIDAWRTQGIAEKHRYDWRMRDVIVERWPDDPQAAEPLTSTFTYLDHAGRVRFVATFEGRGPQSYGEATNFLDPAAFSPSHDYPASTTFASDLIAAGALRISESVYNARGEVEEQRNYNVGDTTGQSYLATLTFYDHAGRPVWSRSPNGGIQKTTYDALGRAVRSSTWAGSPSVEVARTETAYDADGNAVEVTSWERLHDASASNPELDAGGELPGNAVRTRTFNWYDLKRRVIATAELGTADEDDEFVPVGDFPERPEQSPCVHGDPEDLRSPLVGFSRAVFDDSGGAAASRARIRISCFQYDEAGRKTREVLPNGSITEYTYDGLGQLVKMLENADAIESIEEPTHVRRETRYQYHVGKLIGIANVKPGYSGTVPWGNASVPDAQVTSVVYTAEIVKSVEGELQPISTTHEQAGLVVFPTESMGINPIGLRFQYYPDGLLASRTDQRNVKFVYGYDALGRLTTITVDDTALPTPAGPPLDRIQLVQFWYDALDRPTQMKSWTSEVDQFHNRYLVAYNTFAYDGSGNLLHETQSHGAYAVSGVPKIEYEWGYEPYATGAPGEGNFNRLSRMKYPLFASESSRRVLDFSYGSAEDSVDSILVRLTRITDSLLPTANNGNEVARYVYGGAHRLIETYLGLDAVKQSVDSVATSGTDHFGYEGLDSFGRVKDLHFKDAGGLTQYRAEYAHDSAGNRRTARVSTMPAGGTTAQEVEANERSVVYGYDLLQRLTSAGMGVLDSQGEDVGAGGSIFTTEPRRESWFLDPLGNRVGTTTPDTEHGSHVTGDLSSPADHWFDHSVAVDNRITAVSSGEGGNQVGSLTVYSDLAGNRIMDDSYFYQYDAWNRLVQVNMKGSAQVNGSGLITSGTLGNWVIHYTYDALGRLIRSQRRISTFQVKTERFFYDGIRRVQETSGTGAMVQPLPLEIAEDVLQTGTMPAAYRHYIYAPDYVDHFVAQVDNASGAGNYEYMLQDSSYDVVSLVNADGVVLQQYGFDLYGLPLFADGQSAPKNRVGHHGLFFDRLDSTYNATQLTTGARGLYQVRNRTYDPKWQVWMQRDPNASGQVTLNGQQMGQAVVVLPPLPRAEVMFSDGLNIFNYARANPVVASDPLGLFTQRQGYEAEAAIQEVYARDHPGDIVKYGGWTRLGPLGGRAFRLMPDILNVTRRTWAEIKPATPSGLGRAAFSKTKYTLALGPFGINADNWSPSVHTAITSSGMTIMFTNVQGIIFYTDAVDAAEDGVVLTSLAIVEQVAKKRFGSFLIERLLGGGAGTLGGRIGAALANYGAAQVESSAASTTLTSSYGGGL